MHKEVKNNGHLRKMVAHAGLTVLIVLLILKTTEMSVTNLKHDLRESKIG